MIQKELDQSNLCDEARNFVGYYVDILRRETMENNELIKVCQQIYKEHKQALDLIFEYRPDILQDVAVIFDKWCRKKQEAGEIIYDEHKSNKSYYQTI